MTNGQVLRMFNFIRETRAVRGGLHSVILEIPADTYKTFYNDLSEENAQYILTEYLRHRQDDARVSDIKIEHDKYANIVKIYANLHYLENEKTVQIPFTDNI